MFISFITDDELLPNSLVVEAAKDRLFDFLFIFASNSSTIAIPVHEFHLWEIERNGEDD